MFKYKDIYSADSLVEAFGKAQQGSIWKESVQRYEYNLLKNVRRTSDELKNWTYEQYPFYEFTLRERGKTRPIKSMHISDRVVQRSACDNVFVPLLTPYLIYDNGASMKGKGVDFARRRLNTHLHKFYRETGGNEGYILLIDCSKFFDNIRHDILIEMVNSRIEDEELRRFFISMIKQFEVDVSYMSPEEYECCMDTIYNSLEHDKIPKELLTGEKMMRKSVGIGSQISQICGVYYPTKIDTYCKIVKSLKYYGRYMDDLYIIHKDKEYLKQLLSELKVEFQKCGLYMNERKTQIMKLSKGFTFLQVKYVLTDSGKIIRRISHDNVVRMRRKLKKLRRFYDEGSVPMKDIEQAYQSWRGSVKKFNSYNTLRSMDRLYDELFGKEK